MFGAAATTTSAIALRLRLDLCLAALLSREINVIKCGIILEL